MASSEQKLKTVDEIIKQSTEIGKSIPARYRIEPTINSDVKSEQFRKKTFGKRDNSKPHKTILMVGETGSGKTTLINTMVNHMLNIKREDKVWFEITDEHQENDQSSVQSQTSRITVFKVYLQDSPMDLTIIDTPGYGDTHNIEKDREIALSLLSLSRLDDTIRELDAVCLVIKASENRLSDRQRYIFDAVQSLFGRDIAENIVLLFTFSNGTPPRNALMAVKVAKVKCAVNEQKNQPVFFLFDNCLSDAQDEEYEMTQELAWKVSFKGMSDFFTFLNNITPKTLQMTQDVLQQRSLLEAKMANLQSRIQEIELKQNDLKQTQVALEQVKGNEDLEVPVSCKKKVDIDPTQWLFTRKATCCTVCEENCHYPGCWWAKDLSWCSVMKDYCCTVCTNKCHYSKHVKEGKIYVMKTTRKKMTLEDLKQMYGVNGDNKALANKLEEMLQSLTTPREKVLNEAVDCVKTLEKIALNPDSLSTLEHIDLLIEKLKEMKKPEKIKILEEIKKRAGEGKQGALGYKRSVSSKNKK